jgi:plastocyanin
MARQHGEGSNEHDGRSGAGSIATVLSAIALIVSGVSLWETVLKQADLTVHVGDTISYTLDPFGTHEVVAVPITIANGGAQDGAVMKLTLDVKNLATGESGSFDALYSADARYFGEVDDVGTGKHRTKQPFAPLAIAGRAAFTGTLLFYPDNPLDRLDKPILAKQSSVEMVLTTTVPPSTGWLDQLLGVRAPTPIVLRLQIPDYAQAALLSGEMARLRREPAD